MPRSLFAGTVAVIATVLLARSVRAGFDETKSSQTVSVVDQDRQELIRTFPEIANVQAAPDQARLPEILRASGDALSGMLNALVDVSAAEDIHELRLGARSAPEGDRREQYQYILRRPLQESRTGGDAGAVPPRLTNNALWFLNLFLPANQPQSRFRYLGHEKFVDRETDVIAFGQRPEVARLRVHLTPGDDGFATFQGFLWIDSASNRIVRMRTALLTRGSKVPFSAMTNDIRLVAVRFPGLATELWLPARVSVDLRSGPREFYNVHRYTNYRLASSATPGVTPERAAAEPDAGEQQILGNELLGQKMVGEAIIAFREAIRADPWQPEAHYQLGLALWKAGNLTMAEDELRAAVRQAPDSVLAYDSLGVLLMHGGEAAEAAKLFREAARLAPREATVHYNLGYALQESGDRAAALQEYHTALTLSPENKQFSAAYETLSHGPAVPQSDATSAAITVDVRQVLVPVVVTDKHGHHVTGLRQSDFRIFEDGEEQNIVGFRAESSATAATDAGALNSNPAQTPVRHTFIVCVDTLHMDLGNFGPAFDALQRLFREEKGGDSRYALVELGQTLRIVQDFTSDPDLVRKALTDKAFVRGLLDSQHPGLPTNGRLPGTPTSLLSGRENLAYQEALDIMWLEELRALIRQLGSGNVRRTMVLLSDGFTLAPPHAELALTQVRDVRNRLQSVLQEAVRANVAIDSIDSRGLYTPANLNASRRGSVSPGSWVLADERASDAGDTLAQMAATTGGMFLHNSNDLFGALERAFADERDYYMLAYTPPKRAADHKFHAITVQVDDAKAIVHAKKGYWGT